MDQAEHTPYSEQSGIRSFPEAATKSDPTQDGTLSYSEAATKPDPTQD
jgi:hypothetical protein